MRADEGAPPVGISWVKGGPDVNVRTPVVVTAGGGPEIQRVAYGTSDGRLHLQRLADGSPVGAEEGLLIDSGSGASETNTFGQGVTAVGFVDTSTEDQLGQLLIPHNDQAAVYIARIDLRTGERIENDVPLGASLGCTVGSSPLVTPPDPTGGRLLYFTIDGACSAGRGLVRIPITGDAAAPGSQLGTPTYAPLPVTAGSSPALVVLRDPAGDPRFHVAVPREGGVDFYDASMPLSGSLPPSAVPPSATASFGTGELARTPSAAVAANGRVAGGAGSGTGPAPAIYVAAEGQGDGRVYRFVQDGNATDLRRDRMSEPVGVPGPALALNETVLPGGGVVGDLLLVASASNLVLMRTSDLAIVARLSADPLPAGRGFRQTTPVMAGGLAYVSRDGAPATPPEQLVLALDGLQPLQAPAFTPAIENGAPGPAYGQPAVTRGWVVFGSPGGAIAYRNRDVTPPAVALATAVAAIESGTVLTVRAGDARGLGSVAVRLVDGGQAHVIGRDGEPDSGSPFAEATWSVTVAGTGIPDGEYQLEAAAADAAGNTGTSERRRVRVSGLGAGPPPGACERRLRGSRRRDRIVGTAASERILGRGGNDRLAGAGGADCIAGQTGADVVSGGSGADLLEGGRGADVLLGGRGSNRMAGGASGDVLRGGTAGDRVVGGAGGDVLTGGAGDDTLVGGKGRDTIRCGKGRDRVIADRRDRVARDCERVQRRG